jgi:hypothetical protein
MSETAKNLVEQAKTARENRRQVLMMILKQLAEVSGTSDWCEEMTSRVEQVVSVNERIVALDKIQIDDIHQSLASDASTQTQVPHAKRQEALRTARKSLDRLDKTKENPLRRTRSDS